MKDNRYIFYKIIHFFFYLKGNTWEHTFFSSIYLIAFFFVFFKSLSGGRRSTVTLLLCWPFRVFLVVTPFRNPGTPSSSPESSFLSSSSISDSLKVWLSNGWAAGLWLSYDRVMIELRSSYGWALVKFHLWATEKNRKSIYELQTEQLHKIMLKICIISSV